MKPSELLSLVGKPIAYYPQLAKPLGSVNASILFSHFFYWNERTDCELGVYKTADEIEKETGLTRDEQRTARKKLRERGVLIETEKRLEHRTYYKLDLARFDEIVSQSGVRDFPAPKHEYPRPEVGISQSGVRDFPADDIGISQPYIGTEDYQKTTSEDYNRNISADAAAPPCVPSENRVDCKPEKPKRSNRHAADLALLERYGIDGQLAEDHLQIRKAKRQPLTETAMRLLEKEAAKCGMTARQAVEYATGNGWASFRAEYLQNKTFQQAAPVSAPPQHKPSATFQAVAAIEVEKQRMLRLLAEQEAREAEERNGK